MVRHELMTALASEAITMVPTLVENAPLPGEQVKQLPEPLQPLFREWNIRTITENGWEDDIRRLIQEIGEATALPVQPDFHSLLLSVAAAEQRIAGLEQEHRAQRDQLEASQRTIDELRGRLAEAPSGERDRLSEAFAALAQKDFKRMVAYSSVSHMGYVMLGLGVWSAVAGHEYRWDAWAQGVNGAMFQMLAHGISSAGMFFMVGVLYDRVHHRNLEEFGGIFGRMPVYSGMAIAIFFAGLGLPGLCGFIGEVLVTLSSWNYSRVLAAISAFTVILTAAYILWAIQRVYLGAEYKGPHGDHLTPITPRELAIATPLVFFAILFGVAPQILFNYVTPTVNRQVETLADWTRRVHDGPAGLPVAAIQEPAAAQASR
jgi:hypothetical protein